ncbi:MAG: ATP-binding protein, partial [Phycisphaerae bacterium]|nr:ATP-binding protein [Phycisphaerae bacterium]
AELLTAACRRKRIRLELDLDPDMPPVPFDASAIHQALVNLASNAVEAAPDRTGVVTMRTRFVPGAAAKPDDPAAGADADPRAATGPRCEITVEDDGPGVPPEQLAHLFVPFASTKGQRGTGLGLAVTRKLALQHGGAVVHEAPPEGGTRMTLILPAHSTDLDSERTHAPRPLPDGDVGIRFEE